MLNVDTKPGDIFLIDSPRLGSRIVKFFMVAPTMWHHLWRKITGKQEVVKYYHVGMFLTADRIIEQQGNVTERSSEDLLTNDSAICIIRKINLGAIQRDSLIKESLDDLGKKYDIVNIFGKLFTWLTGIKFFARYMETEDDEICINRVTQWYKTATGEDFGCKEHSEVTTQMLYNYVKNNSNKFKIIYEGIPSEDM